MPGSGLLVSPGPEAEGVGQPVAREPWALAVERTYVRRTLGDV